MPPATEVNVQTNAYRYALSGRASDIGISITSGGIGKNELSANETPPRIQVAYVLSAAWMHQSYRRLSMRRLLSGGDLDCPMADTPLVPAQAGTQSRSTTRTGFPLTRE